DLGLKPDPALARSGLFDQQAAHAGALELLALKDRPTAIVTISNMMTMGLLFAVRERGVRVPDELSLVGIDDLEFAPILEPQPTVVVTPILAMARRSIKLLLEQIEGRASSTGEWDVWTPKLIVRHSTAAPPGSVPAPKRRARSAVVAR